MKKQDSVSSNTKDGFLSWIEYRLPIFSFLRHLANYKVPKNLNYAWSLGSIAGIVLVLQILTGLFLAMQYTPHVDLAFDSVENIMRNVNYGWLIRYCHAVGASMFFAVIYLHIARGLYYGSYHKPREVIWFFGLIIFIVMMATAFMGYVLPWGQMSFWGAKVITSLFSAIPFIGEDIVVWLWGGYSVGNPTLNRFFALHFLLPFILVGLVLFHIISLHIHGSNNPSGIEVKTSEDVIPFHPYYTLKDFFGFGVFFLVFFSFVFFSPNSLGHPDNYIKADSLVTPTHIVPEWYFLPFYAILRSIPSKLGGVIAMFGAILVLAFLPWLDGSSVKSAKYRPIFRYLTIFFFCIFGMLMHIGGSPMEEPYTTIGRVCTALYFAHFFIFIPIVSRKEKHLQMPNSINEHFLSSQKQNCTKKL
ncbi:MAG: cytochrome b N-terminal domain-containing protein [Proteobacteria bacterium]|nr:cytochrome b N-terminal domain-containing protein [Pseudomonadota bacterium]